MNLWKIYDEREYWGIHNFDEILAIGKPIIPKNHQKRIENLETCKLLYDGDRDLLTKYYLDELIKYGVFNEDTYNGKMIINNYCKKATRDLISLSLSSNPSITADKKNDNIKLMNWIKEKNIYKKLIEKIFVWCHVSGNCFVHIIPKDGLYNGFQVLNTEQVFPITDEIDGTLKGYVSITRYNQGDTKKARYLISEWGIDSVYDVELNGDKIVNIQLIGSKKTGIDGFSIVNFFVNEDLVNNEYGMSAYTADAISSQSAIVKAENTIVVLQERYGSPIIEGPEIPEVEMEQEGAINGCINGGRIDGEGGILQDNVRRDLMIIAKYFGNNTGTPLKIHEIKGHTDIYADFIKNNLEPQCIKALGNMETLIQRSDKVNVDSSKALRLLYSNAINLAEQYCESIKGNLEWLIKNITKLSKNTNVNVVFFPGIADTVEERAAFASSRVENGTYSIIDSIMYQDNLSEEDAIRKYEKIKEYNIKYPKNFIEKVEEIKEV